MTMITLIRRDDETVFHFESFIHSLGVYFMNGIMILPLELAAAGSCHIPQEWVGRR
jgi:hypothetical protein